MQVRSLGWEDSLEGGHDNPVFLSGESPWTEEPDGLHSMGSQRVGHDRVLSLSLYLCRAFQEAVVVKNLPANA